MTGVIRDLAMLRNGKQLLTLEINSDFAAEADELQGKVCDIEVTEHKRKRSLNANSYMWALCDRIAQKINSTKEDVYRQAIKDVGIFKDVVINNEAVQTFREIWKGYHSSVGFITEMIDEGEQTTIRCYYGSSTYNAKQMARLIDYVVTEAKELGITTETPDNIIYLVSQWEGHRDA